MQGHIVVGFTGAYYKPTVDRVDRGWVNPSFTNRHFLTGEDEMSIRKLFTTIGMMVASLSLLAFGPSAITMPFSSGSHADAELTCPPGESPVIICHGAVSPSTCSPLHCAPTG